MSPFQSSEINRPFDYSSAWKKVAEYESNGLPESALKEVEVILNMALKEKNEVQVVKSAIHKAKYLQRTKEEGNEESLIWLMNFHKTQKGLPHLILASIIGEKLRQYLNSNLHVLYGRSASDQSGLESELANWDIGTLEKKSNEMYELSVKSGSDSKRNIKEIQELLIPGDEESSVFDPTVYDILMHRYLNHLINETNNLTRPVNSFNIQNVDFFRPTEEFVKLSIDTADIESQLYRYIKNSQAYESYLLSKGGDMESIVFRQLQRFNDINNHFNNKVGQDYYEKALESLIARNKTKLTTEEAYVSLAQLYLDRSAKENELTKKKELIGKALEICKSLATSSKNKFAKNRAINLEKNILHPYFSIQSETYRLPDVSTPSNIYYKNLTKVYFKLVQFDITNNNEYNKNYDQNERIKLLNKQPVFQKWTQELKNGIDPIQHTGIIDLMKTPTGNFTLVASDNASFSGGYVYVLTLVATSLNWSNTIEADGFNSVTFFNRNTGKPIAGVKLILKSVSYDRRKSTSDVYTFVSDLNGKIVFNSLPDTEYTTYSGEANFENEKLILPNFFNKRTQAPVNQVHESFYTFTDRSIYRPGQKVHFKTIALTIDEEKPSLVADREVKLSLKDANQQIVETIKLKTNKFGSVSGTFTLPTGRLAGNYSVVVNDHSQSTQFSVEEYKRPTFRILWDTIRDAKALGDEIVLTGKIESFNGFPVSDIEFEYKVVQKEMLKPYWNYYCRYPYNPGPDIMIKTGKSRSTSDGKFLVEFNSLSASKETSNFIFHEYNIEIVATDVNGESQQGTKSIRLGTSSIFTSLVAPQKMKIGKAEKVAIKTYNLENIEQNLPSEFIVEKILSPNKWQAISGLTASDIEFMDEKAFQIAYPWFIYPGQENPINWKTQSLFKTIFGKPDELENKINLNEIKEPGFYRLRLVCKDSKGRASEVVQTIEVYSEIQSSLNPASPFLVSSNQDQYKPGEVCQFTISVSKPSWVYFCLERQANVENFWKWIEKTTTYNVAITDKDKGDIFLHLMTGINNRVHTLTMPIQVPWIEKLIKPEWVHFRNITEPGASEEWRLTISKENSPTGPAEWCATLYDASLDQFRPNIWQWNLWPTRYPRVYFESDHHKINYAQSLAFLQANGMEEFYRTLTSLNSFDYQIYGRRMMQRGGGDAMESAVLKSDKSPQSPPSEDRVNADDANMKKTSKTDDAPDKPQVTNMPRTNLSETVFFFPQITSDKEGNIELKFKMNEALTQWKFQALAYSQSLQYGFMQDFCVTRKEIMVTPNLPRFVRQGDTIIITSKISNTLNTPIEASCSIRLLLEGVDITQEIVKDSRLKSVQIQPIGSSVAEWKLFVPENKLGNLTIEISANNGQIGDGEINTIPILPSKVPVIETFPLYIKSNQSKSFDFKAFNAKYGQSVPIQFTLEMTTNPSWLVIQSLPYLMDNENDCTDQLINRITAKAIGLNLVANTPRLKEFFEKWQKDQSLVSNLNKNMELKSALLEETPWVLEAESETEQMKRLALYFDIAKISTTIIQDWEKLKERQFSNGGLPWLPGMKSNYWVSVYTLGSLGKLKKLGLINGIKLIDIDNFEKSLNSFVDNEIVISYNEKLKALKSSKTFDNTRQYNELDLMSMYARSFYTNIKSKAEAEKIYNRYALQMKKFGISDPIIDQAMIALILSRRQDLSMNDKFYKSWKEKAFKNPDLGMYWKYSSNNNYQMQGIEWQAYMIQVFKELYKANDDIDEMKRYLLSQKQTNRWSNSKATAEAVFAFWTTGTKWQENSPSAPIVTLGGNKIMPTNPTAGAGYYKIRYAPSEIKSTFGKIEVQNPTSGPIWGAAYYSSLEKLNTINSSQTGSLNLRKSVFLKSTSDKGSNTVLINDKTLIKPGDRLVVKLEISSDRDMGYVHVKDLKPAGVDNLETLSGYRWLGGLGYYKSPGDYAYQWFIEYLPKGKFVLEYEVKVTHKGSFTNGISTIQSMYAPEFSGRSQGSSLLIKQ